MRLHPTLYLAASVALCAGAASAQGRADRFDQRDANGDGVMSRDEYTSTGGHPGNFRSLDGNGDGVLTRDEFMGRAPAGDDQAYESQRVNPDFGYHDPAYDPNVLTKDQARKVGSAASRDNFRYKDANRDGVLSGVEYGEQRTFYRVDRNRDGVISYDEYLNPPPAPGPGSTEYDFLVQDRNRDGMLSRDEFGSGRTLSRFDVNRDGLISYDEFRSARRR